MHAIKNSIFRLCTIAIACNLLLFVKASPRPIFLPNTLKAEEQDSARKDSGVQVNYVGTLLQNQSKEVVDLSLELKIKGNSITGKLTITSTANTNTSTFFVSGRITSTAISFNEDYVLEEIGGAAWCKQKFTGTIDANDGVIKGNWQNDGNLYFKDKRLLQGGSCRPGTFVLRKMDAAN